MDRVDDEILATANLSHLDLHVFAINRLSLSFILFRRSFLDQPSSYFLFEVLYLSGSTFACTAHDPTSRMTTLLNVLLT
jgi:hypothetical protein